MLPFFYAQTWGIMAKNNIASYVQDFFLILGAGLVSTGAYMVYEPAGFITAGCFVIYAAYPRKNGGKS